MSDYLLVTDNIAPMSDAPGALGALGLATALASANHRVVVLAQAAPEILARQTGLARRLRPVLVTMRAVRSTGEANGAVINGGPVPTSSASTPLELPLFEGRPTASAAHLFVLGVEPSSRGRTSALLGAAAEALVRDGVIRADVAIGWGDCSAIALAALSSSRRILVVPDGRASATLPPEEVDLLAEPEDPEVSDSLLGRAAMDADAVVVPSPSAAAEIGAHPALAGRPSDQPLAVIRLGCDDPPHDPSSDPALPHHFSPSAPAGKLECRKALARRLTLAVGPRTLLVVAPPLSPGPGAEALLTALTQLGGLDVAVILPTRTASAADRSLAERARILAIENPGRMALLENLAPAGNRELLAGADAAIFVASDDLTGRGPGLALRYGALPLAPDAAASGDFLVDYDDRSATGTALLYAAHDSFELAGAIRRAVTLRTDRERWDALVVSLLTSAPTWGATSARLDLLAEEAVKAAPAPILP